MNLHLQECCRYIAILFLDISYTSFIPHYIKVFDRNLQTFLLLSFIRNLLNSIAIKWNGFNIGNCRSDLIANMCIWVRFLQYIFSYLWIMLKLYVVPEFIENMIEYSQRVSVSSSSILFKWPTDYILDKTTWHHYHNFGLASSYQYFLLVQF